MVIKDSEKKYYSNQVTARGSKSKESLQEKFDCIFSVDFVEHLDKDTVLEFINLCESKLNDGGIFVLRTPCADGIFGAHDRNNDFTHKLSFTSTVLRHLLEMNRFVNVKILDERPFPNSLLNTLKTFGYYSTKLLITIILLFLNLKPPKVWSRSMWAIAYKRNS